MTRDRTYVRSGAASSDASDRAFVRRAMRLPLLSPDEEVALAKRWRETQDQTAMHRLVAPHMRLVIATAVRFRHYGLPLNDLIQEGNLGLMQAAARFEPEREVRFSTYATWWIRAAIQDFVLRNWSIVRTGTTAAHKSLFFNLRRLRARIEGGGREALTDEGRRLLAHQLNVSETDVSHMESRLAAVDRSLNAVVTEDGESAWQDLLVDDRPTPEESTILRVDARRRAGWIGAALATLPAREKAILHARFFSEETVTLERLGVRLGISKERVRQLEHQALKRLRRQLGELPGLGSESGGTAH
ncbi:RNA polymerase factor sigma-32 [Ferrovibrio xuzhouensis]|uniref:RNA polymerase factor sigma-32 n=1 Tax=Ferrovibrio xuzhouensis TaxID=1576914 RepID=A0ABV7VHC0_9PROT